MFKNFKRFLIEQSDTIALLIASIVSVILLTLGILSEKYSSIIILSLLCLLSFHYLRRTIKFEIMSKHIVEIKNNIYSIQENKFLEKLGIIKIVGKRNEIFKDEMHNDAKNAQRVFILSRYFKAFANKSVQMTLLSCLKNNASVKILIYSNRGNHLNVNIEPDITPEEAKVQISQTLRRLKIFKEQIPRELLDKFQYKIIKDHIIYSSIIGTNNKVYATIYLNNFRGDECPSIICCPTNHPEESLYFKLANEFDNLWKMAKYD